MNRPSDKQKRTFLRKRTLLRLAVVAALLLFAPAPQLRAQQAGQEEDNPTQQQAAAQQEEGAAARNGADWMRRLNLSPEQVAQIREIRQQAEGEGRALVRRLNQARRALDEAIYAESASDAVIEERTRAVALAQAGVTRLRATTELKVRRVLTPEQLNVFRELRTQALGRQRRQRQQRRRDARQQERQEQQPANETFDRRLRRRPAAAAPPGDDPAPARPALFPRQRRRGVRP